MTTDRTTSGPLPSDGEKSISRGSTSWTRHSPQPTSGPHLINDRRDMPAIAELREHRQWVAWRYKEIEAANGEKKLTKPPVNPMTGGGASHSNPETWGTFDQARIFTMTRKLPGVGFVLSEDDDFTGIDLDDCRDPETGIVQPWAQEIIDFKETYTEISPSKAGIRMIARGKIESAVKVNAAQVEVYGKQRYLTITADHFPGSPDSINPAPKTIEALCARAAEFKANVTPPPAEPRTPRPADAPPVDMFGPRKAGDPLSDQAKKYLEKNAGTTTARARASKPDDKNKFFRAVNDKALDNLGSWLLELFPFAKAQPGTGGYRVSSKDLGRNLEEDLSVTPAGIQDFGVADMGDAKAGKRTAIDLVMEWGGGTPHVVEAAHWLCKCMGVTPKAMGWQESSAPNTPDEDAAADHANDEASTGPSEENQKKSTQRIIEAKPYNWPDPAQIPRRQWLYGGHLIRRYVSATIAAGGVGKSSLTIAESVAMISGRTLLHGLKPSAPLNVWIWNGEDPQEELERRIAGTFKLYGIERNDCRGRLFVNSGRDDQIVVAKTTHGTTVIMVPIVEAIIETIKANKIDVLIVDPFVSTHLVNENDNGAIDMVTRAWAMVAERTGCAIDLVHHARKMGMTDTEVTVESARGASAMISAVRSARTLNPMTREEAKKVGVENRRTYFRVTPGKANMSPAPEHSQWYEMQSLDLGNGDFSNPGDSIGVVTEWKWLEPLEDIAPDDLDAVKKVLAEGEWRENVQAKEWAGYAVAQALGLAATKPGEKAKITMMLRQWIKSGELRVVIRKCPKGKPHPFIEPVLETAPPPPTSGGDE